MNILQDIIEGYGLEIRADSKIRCPFHKERSGSLHVYPKNYYCYGCGAGGDVITFIKDYELAVNGVEVEFNDVVEQLCEHYSLTKEKLMEEVRSEKSGENAGKGGGNAAMEIDEVKNLIREIGYKSNGYRGIRDEISQFFGHLTKLDEAGNVQARYYPETNNSDQVTGYKCRNHPKDFSHGKIGETGAASQLSGQVKFKSGGKYILIVGGEEDKAAAYQMLLDGQQAGFNGIPVVSSTVGELTAAKQCASQYDFLDQYEIIVIGMDNDAAGQKAAEEISKVLPKHKLRIAKWSGKDPNQMLLAGKQKQFVRDFYNAKEVIETGISTTASAAEGMYEFLLAPKIPLPPHLHRLQHNMRGGIKSTGSIVNIIADTSIGKSLFTDTLIYHWIFHSPLIPTIVSLERTKEELLIDLISMHLEKNLIWFKEGQDAIDYMELPEVKILINNLLFKENGESRFFIIDEREGDLDVLKQQVEKSSKVNGSNLFVFDPLTDLLRALGLDQQDDFLMWQKQQKKSGMVFVNALHTRKPPTDKEGKVRRVTEYDAHGSSTFVQSADVNIVLNRDKMSTDPIEKNTTYVDVPKLRGGVTGPVCELYYDAESRRQYDKQDYFEGKHVLSEEVAKEDAGSKIFDGPMGDEPPLINDDPDTYF